MKKIINYGCLFRLFLFGNYSWTKTIKISFIIFKSLTLQLLFIVKVGLIQEIYSMSTRKNTNKSLLSNRFLSLNLSYSVYTHNEKGEVVRVAIPSNTKTVIQAIQIAIVEFNRIQTVTLEDDLQSYELYAAKPNGNRHKEYPSLDCSQDLALTNMSDFYLKKNIKKPTVTDSMRTQQPKKIKIASDFDERKRPQLQTNKNENKHFCFCG